MAFKFSHDSLADFIEKKYPDMKRNVHFWTAHMVKERTPEQISEAFIAFWDNADIPMPDVEELAKERDLNG